jgi:hypothetical protein
MSKDISDENFRKLIDNVLLSNDMRKATNVTLSEVADLFHMKFNVEFNDYDLDSSLEEIEEEIDSELDEIKSLFEPNISQLNLMIY